MSSESTTNLLQHANQALVDGRFDEAIRLADQALELNAELVPALHISGLAYLQTGRLQPALNSLSRAAELSRDNAVLHLHLGLAQAQSKQEDTAVVSFKHAAELDPKLTDALGNMGLALTNLSRWPEAETAFREALSRTPNHTLSLEGLGKLLTDDGRFDEAVEILQRALEQAGNSPISHTNLGVALFQTGDSQNAINHLERANQLLPRNPDILVNLGKAYRRVGRKQDALDAYRLATEAAPRHRHAFNNLGNTLRSLGRLTDAVAAYRQHLENVPGDAQAQNNLGIAYTQMGRFAEADEAYDAAMSSRPDYALAFSNRLLNLNYDPTVDEDRLFAAHNEWSVKFEPSAPPALKPRPRADNGRIRVGYVSPDFKTHSVAYFFRPLLERHNRQEFETYCYAEVPSPDATTDELRSLADNWRWTHMLSDDDLYAQLRDDDLDIVVDLAGHTSGNRLPVLARRVAPIQVTWIGYPNTTGLKTMDFRFTDDIADPRGEADRMHSEKLFRLPDCFLNYGADASVAEAVALPAQSAGYITFGSFNNISKLNESVVSVWAGILNRVPGSRLILKSRQLADVEVRDSVLGRFVERGISPDRLELLEWISTRTSHLEAYDRIDLALDTFPYAGTTTTCEALWMGVPTVTVRGDRHAGRVGASLLTAIGHPEMIGEDIDAYERIAVELAGDPERLSQLRSNLRRDVKASPLCDAGRFTGNVEAAYREMLDTL